MESDYREKTGDTREKIPLEERRSIIDSYVNSKRGYYDPSTSYRNDPVSVITRAKNRD